MRSSSKCCAPTAGATAPLHHAPGPGQRTCAVQQRRGGRAQAQGRVARRHHPHRDVAAGVQAAAGSAGATAPCRARRASGPPPRQAQTVHRTVCIRARRLHLIRLPWGAGAVLDPWGEVARAGGAGRAGAGQRRIGAGATGPGCAHHRPAHMRAGPGPRQGLPALAPMIERILKHLGLAGPGATVRAPATTPDTLLTSNDSPHRRAE